MDQDPGAVEQYIPLFPIAGLIALGNSFTIYGVVYRKWLVNPKYTKLTLTMLLSSLFYLVISFVLLLQFRSGVGYFWSTWFLSIWGLWLFHYYFIVQLELLFLFSAIAPYWTLNVIRRIKTGSVVLHIVLAIPTYLEPLAYYLPSSPAIIDLGKMWKDIGFAIFSWIIALFCLWEVLYLLTKIYAHHKNTNSNLKLRRGPIVRFAVIYICIELMDWVGIYIFRGDNHFLKLLGFEIFLSRMVLLVYVFILLRHVTFIKDEIFSMTQTNMKLSVHLTSKSVYLAPTLRVEESSPQFEITVDVASPKLKAPQSSII